MSIVIGERDPSVTRASTCVAARGCPGGQGLGLPHERRDVTFSLGRADPAVRTCQLRHRNTFCVSVGEVGTSPDAPGAWCRTQQEDFMASGSGMSRRDLNRNGRLERLRVLVQASNAIVGIDLAGGKRMVVVTDHDSKVSAGSARPLLRAPRNQLTAGHIVHRTSARSDTVNTGPRHVSRVARRRSYRLLVRAPVEGPADHGR